ncbi:MAG: protein-glutamate O-methyltransferase CheR [Planctomycetia bacterium]|nr:protein-glutamate O-methyltransferase CheR [Planctomycetia bacterium]
MELSPAEFGSVRKAVHDLCGLAIGEDKQYLVKTRLEPVLIGNGLASYAALVQRLLQADSLLLKDQVIEAITTNETSFNRDGHPFEELRRRILPELAARLIERRKAGIIAGYTTAPQSRIWCAAVATGQEAYSVGMGLADFLRNRPARDATPDLTPADFPILASDISGHTLAVAQAGRYTPAEVDRGVTADQRTRYFRQASGAWEIDPAIRGQVEFRRLNLTRELPQLGMFDLILCRNLLIYFDQPTRERLCQALSAALLPQGILIIGAAESLFGVSTDLVRETLGQTVVYRKR